MQSQHALHVAMMFSGVDKETTIFDQSREALSAVLLAYFQYQPLPTDFDTMNQDFRTQLAAFKASQHEEFVHNFFMASFNAWGDESND